MSTEGNIYSHNLLALKPLKEKQKVNVEMRGNLAMVGQKTSVVETELVMDFKLLNGIELKSGTKVLLAGDAAFHGNSKNIYTYNGIEFFRAPESAIFGYVKP